MKKLEKLYRNIEKIRMNLVLIYHPIPKTIVDNIMLGFLREIPSLNRFLDLYCSSHGYNEYGISSDVVYYNDCDNYSEKVIEKLLLDLDLGMDEDSIQKGINYFRDVYQKLDKIGMKRNEKKEEIGEGISS